MPIGILPAEAKVEVRLVETNIVGMQKRRLTEQFKNTRLSTGMPEVAIKSYKTSAYMCARARVCVFVFVWDL